VGWLDFISSMVGSLAWPAAVVAVIFIVRRPLRTLLANLRPKQMRYRGMEVDFESKVEALVDAAEAAELPAAEEATATSETDLRLALLVREAPRAAVLESWLAVETELGKLAEAYGVKSTVHALKAAGAVSQELGDLVRQLRELRGAAVHAGEFAISESEAKQYAEACARVAAALRAIREAHVGGHG
jgi:hypothetical protein